MVLSLIQLAEHDAYDSESWRLFHQVLLLENGLLRVKLVVMHDLFDITQVLIFQVLLLGLVSKFVIFVNIEHLLRVLRVML